MDNLAQFKPHLGDHEIEREVERFEESILYFADAHSVHGHLVPRRYDSDTPLSSPGTPFDMGSSVVSSTAETPDLTPGHSAPLSRASSFMAADVRRPSFGSRLLNMLSVAARLRAHNEEHHYPETIEDDEGVQAVLNATETNKTAHDHTLEAWQLEAASVDRSVRILPGVRKMIDSIPAGRYAVATSGAKTYGMMIPNFSDLSQLR